MQRFTDTPRTTGMGRDYRQLFSSLPSVEAPEHLCEQVLLRLSRARSVTWRTALVVSSLSCGASALGAVFAVRALAAASATTGFSSYLSLAATDSSLIAGHFSTFLLALFEALPMPETLVVLGLTVLFFASLKMIGEAYERLPAFGGATLA